LGVRAGKNIRKDLVRLRMASQRRENLLEKKITKNGRECFQSGA